MRHAPLLSLISEKYSDNPSVFASLLKKAQTSLSLSVRRFEPSKFMRSFLSQTDAFLFSRFGSFDAVS